MSTSDLRVLALVLAATAAACDDPTEWLRPPLTDRITLLVVLDPDSANQPLVLTLAVPEGALYDVSGRVTDSTGTVVSSAAGGAESNTWPCTSRYGDLLTLSGGELSKRCLDFEFVAQFEAEYSFTIRADDRPVATGTTVVPGDFEIVTAAASGDPPGTRGFSATWRPSARAYRYLATVRGEDHPRCLLGNCEDYTGGGENFGWFVSTADTTVTGQIPWEILTGGQAPWRVEVYAVDRALYDILVSGSAAGTFPVPPKQNVINGYGVVGAMVRRSFLLP